MNSLFNSLTGSPSASPAPSNPIQVNTLRINENLNNINEWILAIKDQAKTIQTVVQDAQQANTLNRNNNCTKFLSDINDSVNILIETINSGEPLPSPFNSIPKVDNTKTTMTTGGYYYPSTSSSRRNRRKRRNKKSRR